MLLYHRYFTDHWGRGDGGLRLFLGLEVQRLLGATGTEREEATAERRSDQTARLCRSARHLGGKTGGPLRLGVQFQTGSVTQQYGQHTCTATSYSIFVLNSEVVFKDI